MRELVELVRDQNRGDALIALNSSSRSSSASLSASLRLAVGSSRISSLTSLASALAISTSCCLPTPRLVISAVGRFLEADLLQQRLGASAKDCVPVDDAELGRLVAEKDVLGDREQRHQRQLLMNDDDADVFAVGDAGEAARLALVDDVAFIGAVRVDAAEHFHQRRFAGAVLAADGVDLARLHHQIDVAQRFDAGKRLGDAPHFQNCVHRKLDRFRRVVRAANA